MLALTSELELWQDIHKLAQKTRKKIKYDLKLFIGRLTRSIAPTVKPPTAERPTGTSQLD